MSEEKVYQVINFIKVERATRNLSQADLAFRIGVSRKTINTIETGRFIPSTLIALLIAQEFALPVEQIFQLQEQGTETG
jgi:putative transcriptional regulator